MEEAHHPGHVLEGDFSLRQGAAGAVAVGVLTHRAELGGRVTLAVADGDELLGVQVALAIVVLAAQLHLVQLAVVAVHPRGADTLAHDHFMVGEGDEVLVLGKPGEALEPVDQLAGFALREVLLGEALLDGAALGPKVAVPDKRLQVGELTLRQRLSVGGSGHGGLLRCCVVPV